MNHLHLNALQYDSLQYNESVRPKLNYPGKFIVFEGIDGAGTTTQAQMLKEYLTQKGIDCYLTFEPSDSSIGSFVREALQGQRTGAQNQPLPAVSLALLFAADRADHWYNDIQPRLQQGTYVICDRYLYSSLAYQGLSHPSAWVSLINGYYPQPDLLFYLHVEVELAAQRRAQRQQQADLYEQDDLQKKIKKAYDHIFESMHHHHIDGAQTIDSIHTLCLKIVQQVLLD